MRRQSVSPPRGNKKKYKRRSVSQNKTCSPSKHWTNLLSKKRSGSHDASRLSRIDLERTSSSPILRSKERHSRSVCEKKKKKFRRRTSSCSKRAGSVSSESEGSYESSSDSEFYDANSKVIFTIDDNEIQLKDAADEKLITVPLVSEFKEGSSLLPEFQCPDDKNYNTGTICETTERKLKLCHYVFKNVVGYNHVFQGPYGQNVVTYLDYIASGKPLRCIEDYIRDHVMTSYANTHTESSYTAIQTTIFREEARNIIREAVNASEEDAVIFTGSGCTSAINKLIHALKPVNPVVFIGPYEHHSNILPWLELEAKVIRIPQTRDGLLDTRRLHWEVERKYGGANMLIGSFSAASNITGILTDVNTIAAIFHKFDGIVLFDYACAAPYVEIDMNPRAARGPVNKFYKDAIFISPHKFVGGPGTPGVLVAKRYLFRNPIPHNPGGGTVNFVRRKSHRYLVDPEHREEGGTPAIIESIRAGLVFKLKMTFTSEFIMDMEEELYRKAHMFWDLHPDIVILGNQNVVRLPIFPFLVFNHVTGRFVHHNFVAVILNDVFGIQTRGGCACAGPYAMDLLGMGEETATKLQFLLGRPRPELTVPDSEPFSRNGFKPGFVRLNLPYFITEACFQYVLKAVHMAASYCWALLPQYKFDKHSGNWLHKTFKPVHDKLSYVSFKDGEFIVAGESSTPKPMGEITARDYSAFLRRAEQIFSDALNSACNVCPDGCDFTVEEEEMRWFMLPSEAADIINNREVIKQSYRNLPFFPGALARKLGLPVEGHRGRRGSLDRTYPVEYYG